MKSEKIKPDRLSRFGLMLLIGLAAISTRAATRYVDVNNTTPNPPYLSWATAATKIQDAVNFAVAGDEVLVTNGFYSTGQTSIPGRSTNRVAVTRPLTLRSVNGPEATVIDGLGWVRCVYLCDGATLVGFTIRNGIDNQSGGGVFCESSKTDIRHCIITGNSAVYGGGGVAGGTLTDCSLERNSTMLNGGGARYSTLRHCRLAGNSAGAGGGGASYCRLENCTLTDNSGEDGGGASGGILNSCVLSGNSATWFGGGASSGTLNNCTISGNSAPHGGGVSGCTLNNCIVYFNTAPVAPNFDSVSILNYCCVSPQPEAGNGNISTDPRLTSFSHISANSPCRGAGNPLVASGMDIDGEAWTYPPSIGCDEPYPGSETGPLTVSLKAPFTNVVKGSNVSFSVLIDGYASANRWNFGDGFGISNRLVAAHAWTTPGDYTLAVTVWNLSYPAGISATVTVHVSEAKTRYVAAESLNPISPYLSWATAATNIQDAVDVAAVGETVLVTNGVYHKGVMATKPLTIQSVNGPWVTVIDAQRQGRCAYLDNDCVMAGFTLTNGLASYPLTRFGGGAYGGRLNNCILTGNSASGYGGGAYGATLNFCMVTSNSAAVAGGADGCLVNNSLLASNSVAFDGGAAAQCTLNSCALIGNSASWYGGATLQCTLNNCTLTGNSAAMGGGAYGGALANCILFYNTSTNGDNFFGNTNSPITLNYTCTMPLPADGVGNFTNAPLLADLPAGNLRLQSNSPCVNAGNNAYVVTSTDLDGNPRISGRNVDIGAYEYVFTPTGPGTRYVNVNNTTPSPPYTNWVSAATNIQDAVDLAIAGDEIIVTNGVYQTGENVGPPVLGLNRVAVTKPMKISSVNGPEVTIIDGGGTMRCVYLTGGATLTGFTLTNGRGGDGGGVYCETNSATLFNCVLSNNSVGYYSLGSGGAVYGGTLNNCTLTRNSVSFGGGGACSSSSALLTWMEAVDRFTLRDCFD